MGILSLPSPPYIPRGTVARRPTDFKARIVRAALITTHPRYLLLPGPVPGNTCSFQIVVVGQLRGADTPAAIDRPP